MLLLLVLAATAVAHVERPSYFPDPAANAAVKPAAGGKVPKVRVGRLSAFAGGVVNSGSRDLGHGATLGAGEATALYEHWCSLPYDRGFLLYKLYTHAAAFGG